MSDNLRPCPFCGTSGDRIYVDHLGCRCSVCGTLGPMQDEKGASSHLDPACARRGWNRRAEPAALPFGFIRDCIGTAYRDYAESGDYVSSTLADAMAVTIRAAITAALAARP